MKSSVPLYKYDPLPSKTSICLLQILDKPDKGQIAGVIRAVDLDDEPSFCALSYTWGDPNGTFRRMEISKALSARQRRRKRRRKPRIQVFDERQDPKVLAGHLRVTPSLHDFLSVLRDRHSIDELQSTPGLVWVDAVCVNQDDLKERGEQVSMMGRIYTSAELVIAWLGKSDDFTEQAEEVLSMFASIPRDRIFKMRNNPPHIEDDESYKLLGLPKISLEQWRAVWTIGTREWFRRVWVIQEIVLARRFKIFCGYWEIPAEGILNINTTVVLFGWQRYLRLREGSIFKVDYGLNQLGICHGYRRDGDREIPARLQDLVFGASEFRCTDPKDHIYGVLGMLSGQTPLTVDYSLPLESVFQRATKAIICESRTLQIISSAEPLLSWRNTSLPSWVPDYSSTVLPWNRQYGAHGQMTVASVRFAQPVHLVTKGFRWDSLIPSLFLSAKNIYVIEQDKARAWIEILQSMPPIYPTGENVVEAFLRTLLLNEEGPVDQHQSPTEMGLSFRAYFAHAVAVACLGIIGCINIGDEAYDSWDTAFYKDSLNRLDADYGSELLPTWAEVLNAARNLEASLTEERIPKERQAWGLPSEARLFARMWLSSTTPESRLF